MTVTHGKASPVPACVLAAASDLVASKSATGRMAPGLPGALGLWLEASWRTARREGISDEEYAHWVRLDRWNLQGDRRAAREVAHYRAVAGDRGWIFATAQVSPAAAAAQVAEHGVEGALDAAKVMLALAGLAESLPEGERPAQPPVDDQGPEQDRFAPIVFK